MAQEKPTRAADEEESPPPRTTDDDDTPAIGAVLNASGHKQELERQFGLLSICAMGVMVGNAWAALGGSIVLALYNGGPPGVVYEFIAVSVFYWMIAACVAELASAMPSSAGVYHWASVTAGEYGRCVGYFAGWWNFLGYVFGGAAMSSILANQAISMYGLFHAQYEWKAWHVFLAYLAISWLCCLIVMFANRALPAISKLGLFFVLAGVFVTIVVCAVMPKRSGRGYASHGFVWREWRNETGWGSDGLVFYAGMLNGAYAIGVPDSVSHLAEEIPHPGANIPKAITAQMVIGFVTALCYLIAIFYSVHDLDSLFQNPYPFPLAELYRQSTDSHAGSLGLLLAIFLPTFCTCIASYVTAGRMLWTLGRDAATPFAPWVARVHPRFKNPFNATLACGCVCTVLGCIYVGNTTAFNAFVGSFVVLSTMSYLAAIAPHVLSRRKHVVPGPFWMSGTVFYGFAGVACAYMAVGIVVFCFPFARPFDAESMNYSCVIAGGSTALVGAWWAAVRRGGYEGPAGVVEGVERRVERVDGVKG